jgi:dTMP kinase
VVIEGLDGAGKQTLVRALAGQAEDQGVRIATLAFPRYGASVHADLVRDALYGRLGDLSASVYGTALLFALDRRGAKEQIAALAAAHDLVVLDRYTASNAAYGSARLRAPGAPDGHAADGFAEWVQELEMGRFGLPVPDRQILLSTAPELAAARARGRAAEQSDRALDRFEADSGLQERTATAYRELASAQYLSPWLQVHPGADGAAGVELAELLE